MKIQNLSQAGKYLSILGVNPSDKKILEISINKVINSYKKKQEQQSNYSKTNHKSIMRCYIYS